MRETVQTGAKGVEQRLYRRSISYSPLLYVVLAIPVAPWLSSRAFLLLLPLFLLAFSWPVLLLWTAINFFQAKKTLEGKPNGNRQWLSPGNAWDIKTTHSLHPSFQVSKARLETMPSHDHDMMRVSSTTYVCHHAVIMPCKTVDSLLALESLTTEAMLIVLQVGACAIFDRSRTYKFNMLYGFHEWYKSEAHLPLSPLYLGRLNDFSITLGFRETLDTQQGRTGTFWSWENFRHILLLDWVEPLDIS